MGMRAATCSCDAARPPARRAQPRHVVIKDYLQRMEFYYEASTAGMHCCRARARAALRPTRADRDTLQHGITHLSTQMHCVGHNVIMLVRIRGQARLRPTLLLSWPDCPRSACY